MLSIHVNMHFLSVGYMLLQIEIVKCFTESLFSSWMRIAGSYFIHASEYFFIKNLSISCGFYFNNFVLTNSFLLSIGYGEKEGRKEDRICMGTCYSQQEEH